MMYAMHSTIKSDHIVDADDPEFYVECSQDTMKNLVLYSSFVSEREGLVDFAPILNVNMARTSVRPEKKYNFSVQT